MNVDKLTDKAYDIIRENTLSETPIDREVIKEVIQIVRRDIEADGIEAVALYADQPNMKITVESLRTFAKYHRRGG